MEPTVTATRLELEELQRMYRSVIYDAVHDLALGTDGAARDVRRWMYSGSKGFGTVCYLANWDESWVRDMFLAILRIEGDLRKPVVRECLLLMRGVMRIASSGHSDYITPRLQAEAYTAVAGESRLSYASARYNQQAEYPEDASDIK